MPDQRAPHLSIAYIAQTFPGLTQTFVYREVLALRGRGFSQKTSSENEEGEAPEDDEGGAKRRSTQRDTPG